MGGRGGVVAFVYFPFPPQDAGPDQNSSCHCDLKGWGEHAWERWELEGAAAVLGAGLVCAQLCPGIPGPPSTSRPASLCSRHSLAPRWGQSRAAWPCSGHRCEYLDWWVVCPSWWASSSWTQRVHCPSGSLDDARERVDGHEEGLGLGFGPFHLLLVV